MVKAKSLKKQVEETLEKRVAPLFELDRGTLEVVSVRRKEGRVQVRLGGTYCGSPYRDTLVKLVLEPLLTSEFDAVETVEWVD